MIPDQGQRSRLTGTLDNGSVVFVAYLVIHGDEHVLSNLQMVVVVIHGGKGRGGGGGGQGRGG